MEKKRILAIIPARSGSKGLPDKNILKLNDKPLMAYTIEAAKASGIFDIVHVSTDSPEYSRIAEGYGADMPFLRDSRTSGDISSSWDVVREVLRKYRDHGKSFDLFTLLQPTSPLRTAEDIRKAWELYQSVGAKTLTSVTEVDHPVQWCFPLDEQHSLQAFASSPFRNARRQELEKHYHENGAIYIASTKEIMDPDYDFYRSDCYAYMMDKENSIDIDTFTDFKIAETLIKERLENEL